jgi:hypothetical protein
MITLTDEERESFRRLAPDSVRAYANYFTICPLCGLAVWRSSGHGSKMIYVDEGKEPCDRCQRIYQRDPELVQWVQWVVAWRERHIDELKARIERLEDAVRELNPGLNL